MAGVEARLLLPQRHHPADGGFDLLPRSARDVRPAHTPREDQVTDDLVVPHHERHLSQGMSRRVEYPDTKTSNIERPPVFEGLVVIDLPLCVSGMHVDRCGRLPAH